MNFPKSTVELNLVHDLTIGTYDDLVGADSITFTVWSEPSAHVLDVLSNAIARTYHVREEIRELKKEHGDDADVSSLEKQLDMSEPEILEFFTALSHCLLGCSADNINFVDGDPDVLMDVYGQIDLPMGLMYNVSTGLFMYYLDKQNELKKKQQKLREQ